MVQIQYSIVIVKEQRNSSANNVLQLQCTFQLNLNKNGHFIENNLIRLIVVALFILARKNNHDHRITITISLICMKIKLTHYEISKL